MRRPRPLRLLLALAAVELSSVAGSAAGESVLDRRAAEVSATLAARRLAHVRFDGADLDAVLAWLRAATGMNVHVRRDVLAKAGIDPAAIRTSLDLDDVSVGVVLLAVLAPNGLAAVVRDGVVVVTTKIDALGPPTFALYDLRALTRRRVDFRGPDLDLRPSGAADSDDRPLFGDEVVVEDPLTDPQAVVDLVKEIVDAPWDAQGWTLRATTTYLAVKAPVAIQRRVRVALVQIESLR